jgi:DNA-binding transcriptional LysR family regulator
LNERNVDLLIVQKFDLFSEERFDFDVLYDTFYRVVAGGKHPLARRRKVELAGLLKESWVLPSPESVFGLAAMNAFRASGFDYPRATVFAAEADVRMSLLKSGHFLSIFTTSVLRFATNRSDLRVLPVELPTATRPPVGIVTLKNRTLGPVARLFMSTAHEVAKPHAK